jgi:hypothetical protein
MAFTQNVSDIPHIILFYWVMKADGGLDWRNGTLYQPTQLVGKVGEATIHLQY